MQNQAKNRRKSPQNANALTTKRNIPLNCFWNSKLKAQSPDREYTATDFTALTGRNHITEARYLKRLWQQGKLNREWKNRQYYYTLVTTESKTVSQNEVSNPQTDL